MAANGVEGVWRVVWMGVIGWVMRCGDVIDWERREGGVATAIVIVLCGQCNLMYLQYTVQ